MVCGNKRRVAGGILAALLMSAARPALAYIDLAPTFSKVVGAAPTIIVVEVSAFDRDTGKLTLKPVQALKGALPTGEITHQVAAPGGVPVRQIIQWATPGARAVLFLQAQGVTRNVAL